MAYADFVKKYAADRKVSPESLLQAKPLSFPMSTNSRGEEMIEFLRSSLALELKGKRVLDIGCAYGGFSIALAKAGAIVSAVDVSKPFIDYATVNASQTAEVDFHVADASSVSLRKLFPKGSFDFIVLNDVLEHIYDTAGLISNLDWLLNEAGRFYFKVPNAHSPRWAISEGHRKIFGLTLLDPDCWFHLYPKRASIFYRRLAYFQSIFEHYNFPKLLFVDQEEVFTRFPQRKLDRDFKELAKTARTFEYPNAEVKVYLRQGISRFHEEYLYDLENSEFGHVQFKYGSYFFTGFAGRPGAQLTSVQPAVDIKGLGLVAERGSQQGRLGG
jgi:2-polyprenyl-3-methyl-5-hydroxy-6-metoxy-1,4-benzoquinol methylase